MLKIKNKVPKDDSNSNKNSLHDNYTIVPNNNNFGNMNNKSNIIRVITIMTYNKHILTGGIAIFSSYFINFINFVHLKTIIQIESILILVFQLLLSYLLL